MRHLSRIAVAMLALGLMLGAAQATIAGHLFHSTPPQTAQSNEDVTGSISKPAANADITGSIKKPHKAGTKKTPAQ